MTDRASRERRVAASAYTGFSEVTDTGGAVVLGVPEAPASPMLNRIVGLGVGRPATPADVDAALAAIAPGVTFYAAVAPGAQPAQLPDWLRERGLEPGWGWMAFGRGVEDPPPARTSLRLAEVDADEHAAAFARVVREAYGLPAALDRRLAAAVDAGWLCWVAYDGDEPAAAAGLYVEDGAGYLGFAGTLPGHRGKGGQGALLATRIARARALGCDVLVTETGERRDDRPSNSYRNILRAGFEERAVTAHWVGRR